MDQDYGKDQNLSWIMFHHGLDCYTKQKSKNCLIQAPTFDKFFCLTIKMPRFTCLSKIMANLTVQTLEFCV